MIALDLFVLSLHLLNLYLHKKKYKTIHLHLFIGKIAKCMLLGSTTKKKRANENA